MDELTNKKYVIGDKTYFQKPLLFYQILQLMEVIKDVRLPEVVNAAVIVMAAGNKLVDALAIVLTEEGADPRNKDVKALADQLSFTIMPEQTLIIIEDFFGLNPIPEWLERIASMNKIWRGKVKEVEAVVN